MPVFVLYYYMYVMRKDRIKSNKSTNADKQDQYSIQNFNEMFLAMFLPMKYIFP